MNWSIGYGRKLLLTALLGLFAASALSAAEVDLPTKPEDFRHVKADSWSVVGRNLIAKGNVHVPARNLEIYADEVVLNLDSRDLEAVGNIRLYQWRPFSGKVAPEQLEALENRPDTLVSRRSIVGDLWGDQVVGIDGYVLTDTVRAHRLSGNINSGYFRGDQVELETKSVVCRGDSLERMPDGVLKVKNGEFSSCNYLLEDNAHYSIGAAEITFYPYHPERYGVEDINVQSRDHSIWLTNGFAKAYGVPVLWLPFFYKPKDYAPGLFGITWGKSSSWGYFFSFTKRFDFVDYPAIGAKLNVDYYTLRGVGYGGRIWLDTDDSTTRITAYSIHDLRPNETSDYRKYRLRVPHNRYNFRVSNVTHITPRLDFRGAFDWSSDYYFTRDFFAMNFSSDPQPATYAALEQQFDRFSISALIRPRVNRFYTTVEKFPDIRLDIIRQELLNTGIYYQGDFDVSYMKMRWLHFDGHPRSKQQREYTDLHDYENFRFDTTHFLYLPLNFKWINIVPRAGFKFTTYGATSKQKVSTNDLLMMFSAANPQSMSEWESVSYDRDGGGKIRVVGELGVEVSTKIHNTWNDVRSRFLGLDGLRHIIRPYMNYTYISSPNVKPENLMYFDDIDRIDSQNFFRFGLENRLQTRSGGGVRDYFSMENFWDLYLTKEDGFANVKRFGNIGNVGTIVTWTPIERLTLSSSILISLTDENGPLPDVIRKGRNVGKVGLGVKWIDRWNISLSYRPIDDVTLYLRYTYQRPYSARSSYSIGSTLTQIDGGGYFNKYFGSHTEILSFGAALPLTPDRRTRGTFDCSYDVMEGGFSNISFSLVRTFHCWELIGTLGFEADDDASSGWDTQFSIQARLIGLEAPLQNRANSVLSEMDSFSTNSPSKRLF